MYFNKENRKMTSTNNIIILTIKNTIILHSLTKLYQIISKFHQTSACQWRIQGLILGGGHGGKVQKLVKHRVQHRETIEMGECSLCLP